MAPSLLVQFSGLGDSAGVEVDGQKAVGREHQRQHPREPPERVDRRRDGEEPQHRGPHDRHRERHRQRLLAPQRLGQPTKQGVLHHVDEPEREQHGAERAKANRIFVDVEFRRVDVDRQAGGSQNAREDRKAGQVADSTARHQDTSRFGGTGRGR